MLELLGTEVALVRPTGIRLLVTAKPQFANSTGGIHGGFGVLMGERALDVALRAAMNGQRSMRPVELRAAFLRPILADRHAHRVPRHRHAPRTQVGRRSR